MAKTRLSLTSKVFLQIPRNPDLAHQQFHWHKFQGKRGCSVRDQASSRVLKFFLPGVFLYESHPLEKLDAYVASPADLGLYQGTYKYIIVCFSYKKVGR